MPLVIVSICLILSALLRNVKWKKRLFIAALAMLLFFSNDFIYNELMLWWEEEPIPYAAMDTTYTWGIVLTGVTLTDKQPADRVYFSKGADRAVHAVELYKKGIIKKILISGGSGRLLTEGRKEADDLYRAFVLMGVPAEDLLIENESRNTHESAVRVKEILKDDTNSKLLITSAFHMRRSVACFRKVGLETDIFPVDYYTHKRRFTPDVLFIPRVESLSIWQKLIKEWVGMIAYKVVGYI